MNLAKGLPRSPRSDESDHGDQTEKMVETAV